jgi:hypothetical protein
MIAAKLRPMFDERAKERQMRKPIDSVVEKIPQQNSAQLAVEASKLRPYLKARDEAGKAAGVNGRYVDMARSSSLQFVAFSALIVSSEGYSWPFFIGYSVRG